ncbi:Uncharacterized protein TCM_022476 [Theobroma cacao]|uniref:Uncharacterized protein n=1 Tax=Theobroma cacao TaxID=3641 RepID=A0A061F0V9_THECC|nr:Uncharacterized protein TCM_022476 [Theobroma cacao]
MWIMSWNVCVWGNCIKACTIRKLNQIGKVSSLCSKRKKLDIIMGGSSKNCNTLDEVDWLAAPSMGRFGRLFLCYCEGRFG